MKHNYFVLTILMVLVLTLAACGQAQPANRLEAIQDAGTIVVGTSADYEPWEFKDENDEFVGIDMEIMRELARRMDVDVEFQDLGFDTLVAAVEAGNVDAVIAAMAGDADRRQQADFSIAYYTGDYIMIAQSDSGIAFDDPLEAANYTLGTQTGTVMVDWVQENLITPGLMTTDTLMLYDRIEQVALDLQAGRIEIAILDLAPGQVYIDDPDYDFIEVWSGIMAAEGYAIAIMKGEDELKSEIDSHLQAMIADGFIDGVLADYGVE
jgi:ABC-type amino acid transport substrate-binding protein